MVDSAPATAASEEPSNPSMAVGCATLIAICALVVPVLLLVGWSLLRVTAK